MPLSSGFHIKPIPTYLSPKTSASSAIFFVTISIASVLPVYPASTQAIARSSFDLLELVDVPSEQPATKINDANTKVILNLFIIFPISYYY